MNINRYKALVVVLWHGFKRDYISMLMAFLLPILFFTSMVHIQNNMTGDSVTDNTKIGILDLDKSTFSKEISEQLGALDGVKIKFEPVIDLNVEDIGSYLVDNNLSAMIIFPKDMAINYTKRHSKSVEIDIIEDRSNPIYRGVIVPVLDNTLKQLVTLTALKYTPIALMANVEPFKIGSSIDVIIKHQLAFKTNSNVDLNAMYSAAGLGVLFLLFSMAGGGATIIDDRDSGILQRTLSTGVTSSMIILSRWFFLLILGGVQVILMFIWGEIVFGIGLLEGHKLGGFILLTLVTSSAAAALGIVFAVICNSRMQLNAISTIVILVMSALGGSLFPRYLMSEQLLTVGSYTFNSWALVGYQKLLWYDLGIESIVTELAVLTIIGGLLLFVALLTARRWH